MCSYYAKVMLNKATSPKSLKANLRWQRPARACWDAVALLTQSQQHIDWSVFAYLAEGLGGEMGVGSFCSHRLTKEFGSLLPQQWSESSDALEMIANTYTR